MKTFGEIREVLQSKKIYLVHKYGISKIAVFGSYSQGLQNENSDIDILVEYNKPMGVEFIDLANELEKILENRVDLVSRKGIKPAYYKQIEGDLKYV